MSLFNAQYNDRVVISSIAEFALSTADTLVAFNADLLNISLGQPDNTSDTQISCAEYWPFPSSFGGWCTSWASVLVDGARDYFKVLMNTAH